MAPGSRRLQFRLRELNLNGVDSPPPIGGFIKTDQALVLVNRMRTAQLWGDGPQQTVRIDYGQTMQFDAGAPALQLISVAYR